LRSGTRCPATAGGAALRGSGTSASDRALVLPVAAVTVLSLSADAFWLCGDPGRPGRGRRPGLLAPVVTALLAHALTAERPSAPGPPGRPGRARHAGRVRR
jgi:hypothetical protein